MNAEKLETGYYWVKTINLHYKNQVSDWCIVFYSERMNWFESMDGEGSYKWEEIFIVHGEKIKEPNY